jgi:hypothetical protein
VFKGSFKKALSEERQMRKHVRPMSGKSDLRKGNSKEKGPQVQVKEKAIGRVAESRTFKVAREHIMKK